MNLLDLVVLALLALAGYGGHRLGFAVRLISWLGMALGLVVTARFLPSLVELTGVRSGTAGFLVAAALLVGGSLAGLALGLAAGSRAHLALLPEGRVADHALGAAAGILAVLAAVWLLTPVMADVPGRMSRQARGSGVARLVAAVTPDPPDTTHALRRLVGSAAFPQVIGGLDRSPAAGLPPTSTGLPSDVAATAGAAAVRVEVSACEGREEGSGFFVEPGIAVTNAHVVAGAGPGDVEVLGAAGARARASVVHFDPDLDLALLSVSMEAPVLPLGDAAAGAVGAVLGHPSGRELRLAPFRVSEEIVARGWDLHNERRVERAVLVLASELSAGDSGAGLVDRGGRIVGVAFAVAPDDPQTAYALDVEELRRALSAPRGGADTGPCLP